MTRIPRVPALLFSAAIAAVEVPAQTPTNGPGPTPTPPAPVYLSDEFMANTVTTNNQRRPSVAAGTDGNFLVVWHGDAAQTGFYDIKGQLFNPNGVPIGGEFQVDQAGPNRIQYTPHVVAGGNGNFIVVWADFNQTVTDAEVWVRVFDGAANPLANAGQVNTFTTGRQRLPRASANASGEFVVVWESDGQDGDGLGVFGQQFDAAGDPVGPEFAVNTATTGDQDRAAVDVNGSGFIVAFEDDAAGVAAREFSLLPLTGPGAPAGGQFPVLGPGYRAARLTTIGDGTSNTLFVAEHFDSGSIVAIRRVDGTIGNPFLVAGGSPGTTNFNPDIAAAADHLGFVALWGSQTGGEYFSNAREYGWNGSRLTDNRSWPWLSAAPLPYVEQGAFGDYQFIGAGQRDAGGSHDVWLRRAHHPVAQFVLCDGSVRPIQEGVSTNVWMALANRGSSGLDVEGALTDFLTGSPQPAGESVAQINDGTADYGTIAPGASVNCDSATGDCYNLTVLGPRPATHWDEAVQETLSTGVQKTWLLHLGGSFADVPDTNLFYVFIETLLHNAVTGGGACGGYCPADGVKRQQMAVFLLKSRFGSGVALPPASGAVFADVPASNPFAAFIEILYGLGITGGCQTPPPPALPLFCPDAVVNRQQMAVFLLKALEGSGYTPPACTGVFQDVPCGNPFAPWIEELYARLVTGGCSTNPLLYCPTNDVTRGQMAAFLVKNFGLLLSGP